MKSKEPLTMEQRALCSANLDLARKIAAKRYKSYLPPEDREQEAYIGLVNAARSYNPDNAAGASFATYAARCIHGAIVDAERSRSARLVGPSGYTVARGVPGPKVASLDAERPGGTLSDSLAVAAVEPEYDARESIHVAVATLPNNERSAVAGYFLQLKTMRETAESIGVTVGRVSQLLGRAVVLLQASPALVDYRPIGFKPSPLPKRSERIHA